MSKMISTVTLGYGTGNVNTFAIQQGSIILECVYSRNSGIQIHFLMKDNKAPTVSRTFVAYSAYAEPKELENRKRYWHVGTAHQKMEPQFNPNGTISYIPDDINYFVFEVE